MGGVGVQAEEAVPHVAEEPEGVVRPTTDYAHALRQLKETLKKKKTRQFLLTYVSPTAVRQTKKRLRHVPQKT